MCMHKCLLYMNALYNFNATDKFLMRTLRFNSTKVSKRKKIIICKRLRNFYAYMI